MEALGLKTLFAAFMNKVHACDISPKLSQLKFYQGERKSKSSAPTPEDTGHILGILSSLFFNLPSESVPRIRLLSKFADSEYEKVDRLLEIRESAVTRLKITDREIAAARTEAMADADDDEDDAELWYLRRLDGGLFTLQTVDTILGWICMEDDGVSCPAILIVPVYLPGVTSDAVARTIHIGSKRHVTERYCQRSERIPWQHW